MAKKPPAPRRTPVKEAHHVLQDALLKAGETEAGKHAQIAKSLGVSASMLYKWREPAEKGSGQPNPLHRTALLIDLTADTRIVDWLAQRAGGQFTPVEGEAPSGNLDKAANALVREFGLLIADVADAIRPSRHRRRDAGAPREMGPHPQTHRSLRATLRERRLQPERLSDFAFTDAPKR